MSETPQGSGWGQASDGKWYPPSSAESTPRSVGSGQFAPEQQSPAPIGANYPTYGPTLYLGRQQTNGLAIASLVLGILWLSGLGSFLALIFGYISKRQIH